MKIELTSEEASLLIGIIAIWKTKIPHYKYEEEMAMLIAERIFIEDKKMVDEALRGKTI